MMTIARRNLVDSETPGFYHCTNRCVRRTFLCGIDDETGIDYSHRKGWLEKRMLALCSIFSVDIYAYAVMSNHYHIVLYVEPLAPLNWTDETVAERWLQAYPGRFIDPNYAQQRELKKQAIMADKEKLKTYRKRLGSLSWFMGRLNEPLAKQSNQEDYCTGRFWEGRYSSQALLDEAAVFSCMAYVDLNPIRADIAERLEESEHTAIKQRVELLKSVDSLAVEKTLNQKITCINDKVYSKQLPLTLKNYIELVEYTGQSIKYRDKASMPTSIQSTLSSLNLQQNHWLKQVENFGKHYCHVVGPIELIREKAKQLKKKYLRGISAARLLYEKQVL
jgi:REP element-mobilizing transposase RayT